MKSTHSLPLSLDDASEGSEDDLPGKIHGTPELGVENAERASVFPEVVHDLGVRHEALEGTLRACLCVGGGGQRLCEAQELVRVELAHVAARRAGGRARSRGEQGLQRRKEGREQRISAFCVQVGVQVGEGGGVRHGNWNNRQIESRRFIRRPRGRESGQEGAVCCKHERMRRIERACRRRGGRLLCGKRGCGGRIGGRRRRL